MLRHLGLTYDNSHTAEYGSAVAIRAATPERVVSAKRFLSKLERMHKVHLQQL